jgi:hypothetical protein
MALATDLRCVTGGGAAFGRDAAELVSAAKAALETISPAARAVMTSFMSFYLVYRRHLTPPTPTMARTT